VSAAADVRVAVVTGGNRGIGLDVCRQLAQAGLAVILTSRDPNRGELAARNLARRGLDVRAHELDIADPHSIEAFGRWARSRLPQVDVLVNNAAIDYDTDQRAASVDFARLQQAWETNTLGAWRLTIALLPMLRAGSHARVVNVSSESGSLASMSGGTPAYSVTKAALNAVTRMLAAELARDRILVNAVCPGWTNTDMGGGGRAVEEGAASVVWAALLDDDGPTGGFFRDGEPLPW
jgi:NAD(P)-dependent dehydrogenase (short-subunit alcohol dehydrogenase family)